MVIKKRKQKMTLINGCYFAAGDYIRNRWKYILSFIVFIVFFIKLFKYQHLLQQINNVFEDVKPQSETRRRDNFYHPQCMNQWLDNRSSNKILPYVKEKFRVFEGTVFIKKSSSEMEVADYSCGDQSVRLIAPNRENFFGHFPHFSEMYFRFYSLMLWQKRVYNFGGDESCIHSFAVDRNIHTFWKIIGNKRSWIRDLVSTINSKTGYQTLTSNVGKSLVDFRRYQTIKLRNKEGYFLHPSDSLMLSSTILDKNPCELHGRAFELLSQKVNFLIIDRKSTRRILNLNNVTQTIQEVSRNESIFARGHHHRHPGSSSQERISQDFANISYSFFESKSFSEQVKTINQADIVFSIHGAQLTNIVFMKPCSVLIEVMPWLYNVPSYFGRFSTSADLLHYTWEETPENSISNPGLYNPFDILKCNEFKLRYYSLHQSGHYSSADLDDLCYHDGRGKCRSCFRQVEGLVVNVKKLRHYLTVAVKERQKCILQHPFYNHGHKH
jgi:hypothetical protein